MDACMCTPQWVHPLLEYQWVHPPLEYQPCPLLLGPSSSCLLQLPMHVSPHPLCWSRLSDPKTHTREGPTHVIKKMRQHEEIRLPEPSAWPRVGRREIIGPKLPAKVLIRLGPTLFPISDFIDFGFGVVLLTPGVVFWGLPPREDISHFHDLTAVIEYSSCSWFDQYGVM